MNQTVTQFVQIALRTEKVSSTSVHFQILRTTVTRSAESSKSKATWRPSLVFNQKESRGKTPNIVRADDAGYLAVAVWYLCDICGIFVWYLCDICGISVWYLFDICLISVWYLWDICVISVCYLWDICLISLWYVRDNWQPAAVIEQTKIRRHSFSSLLYSRGTL